MVGNFFVVKICFHRRSEQTRILLQTFEKRMKSNRILLSTLSHKTDCFFHDNLLPNANGCRKRRSRKFERQNFVKNRRECGDHVSLTRHNDVNAGFKEISFHMEIHKLSRFSRCRERNPYFRGKKVLRARRGSWTTLKDRPRSTIDALLCT